MAAKEAGKGSKEPTKWSTFERIALTKEAKQNL